MSRPGSFPKVAHVERGKVFYPLCALREAAQRAKCKGSINPGIRCKGHATAAVTLLLIPTILREPSSHRPERRPRITAPRSQLAKNMSCSPRAGASAADRD